MLQLFSLSGSSYFSENLGIEPETSGSIARRSDHQTTEAVHRIVLLIRMKMKLL
jgi:hypothetical protein